MPALLEAGSPASLQGFINDEREDRFAQPGGVPVDDDGGEQIEACQALRALERFRIKTACSECRPC